MRHLYPVLLLLAGAFPPGAAQAAEAHHVRYAHYGMKDFYRVPKIDAHMHLHGTDSSFMREAERDRFRVLSINVDYADFPPIEEQERIAQDMLRRYPLRFAYAATFHASGIDEPGWREETLRHIDESVAHGAVAVKVWKNVGMALRDSDGRLVMVDDPRLSPIFEHLAQAGIPLLGHQGEPRNCWLPLSEMSVESDREYFASHPQYHMYLHPEMPGYEDQLRARDTMLARHPSLKFVGLHMASLEWSVDRLADFLERFPNTSVDLAARIGQLQSQALRDPEKVRNFLIRYHDRILYATDLEQDAKARAFGKEARTVWLRDWRFFNTADIRYVPDLGAKLKGLALPTAVVDKIYHLNAERLFPGAWGGPGPLAPGKNGKGSSQ